jgi:hypothetical protein
VLALVRQLHAPAREYYRLEVELPAETEKPRDWKLDMVDAQGKRRKDVGVVYPQKLGPCGGGP